MLIIAAYYWQSEWNPCCEPIFWAAPELRFRRWGQNSVPATLADQKRVSRKEDMWYSLHTMISTYHKDLGTNIINSFLRFVVAIVTTNVSGKEIKYLFYNHTLEDRHLRFVAWLAVRARREVPQAWEILFLSWVRQHRWDHDCGSIELYSIQAMESGRCTPPHHQWFTQVEMRSKNCWRPLPPPEFSF